MTGRGKQMRYQIIARRMSPETSRDYRNVVAVKYRVGGIDHCCGRDQMILKLERGATAFVEDQHRYSDVGIFDLNRVKYLRSYFDDYWDNSLVVLPSF